MLARLSSSPFAARLAAIIGLVLLTLLAWSRSFDGPFVLDDVDNLANNASLRSGEWRDALSPPANTGLGGRPVLNFTFAWNYQLGGLAVRGYHVTNLAIHLLAALALFELLRCTFRSSRLPPQIARSALPLAFAVALLWALHPVQTQAVTYLSQRAESLMALFYLKTLVGAARCFTATSPRRRAWWAVYTVLVCALGMATKETMVTAPLVVLLYDRTFFSGRFAAALRTRARFYAALGSTWILLVVLLADVGARGVGASHGVSSYTYALTECRAVVHYLRLALWPHPLVFDYGTSFAARFGEVAIYAVILAGLLGVTVYALARRPALGFAAACFFVLLAPTSSVVPIAFSPVAESRLYLPLAAVLTLVVLAWHSLHSTRLAVGAVAVGFTLLTLARNRTYASDLALWSDTAAKCPASPAAHYNLGLMLSKAGRLPEAITQWETTTALDPRHAPAHNNLANTLVALGRAADAVPHYDAALHFQPDASVIRGNYGLVLLQLGRTADAEAQLRLALKQNPTNFDAHNHLGLVFQKLGRTADEIACYQAALRLEPNLANARRNLGFALARSGHIDAGLAEIKALAHQLPSAVELQLDLARILITANRPGEARGYAEAAVRLAPDSADAYLQLGNCLAYLGDYPRAVSAFEQALRLRPNFPDAAGNLAQVRARLKATAAQN